VTTAVPAAGPARAAALPRRRERLARLEMGAGLALVAPQALGFAVFVGLPVLAVFGISLLEWNVISGQVRPIGLANYAERMPADPRLPDILRSTLWFIGAFVPLTVLGGLALAVATDRPRPGMAAFRAIFFLPVVISLAAWAMIWRIVLQPDGVLNASLALAGLPGPRWLTDPSWAMWAVAGVAVLKTVGFTMVLFHAALQNVPQEVIEASYVDGARPWQRFLLITLPLIAPFTFLVVVLVTINSFKTFALFYVLTQGGPGDVTRTLSYYVYEQGFRFFQMGYASALAALLFAAVFVLTLVQFLARRRWVHDER
jgi:multiple sugar transport system permease protein